ncbi:MAG: hypothetical protein GY908_03390 [Flavobacteriales bacterium]|nr:hypothetical protein [Flavobacteriales bacterium]
MKKDYLILFILICFGSFVHSQDIQVRGNGNVIALNNSNQSPTEKDGTSFGEVLDNKMIHKDQSISRKKIYKH